MVISFYPRDIPGIFVLYAGLFLGVFLEKSLIINNWIFK